MGARVRHSAHGKGHEEGGSTYAKAISIIIPAILTIIIGTLMRKAGWIKDGDLKLD